MIDRLISGAGWWANLGDRLVRAVTTGGAANAMTRHKPGSVFVGIALLVLAGVLAFLGIESTDNSNPRSLTAQEVADTADFGRRTYAAVSGEPSFSYVETYEDEDGDSVQDPDETGVEWEYFVVDPDSARGVVVRTDRAPEDIFAFEAAGELVPDRAFVEPDIEDPDVQRFATELGVAMEDVFYVDASDAAAAGAAPIDYAALRPGADVIVTGRALGWFLWCSADPDGDGTCDPEETDRFDVIVMDRATGHGIVVLVDERPVFHRGTFTGMLRRDPAAVERARNAPGIEFGSLGLTVSDVYYLDEGDAPASAPLVLGGALVALIVGVLMLVGYAGGYLVYRKTAPAFSPVRRPLEVGEAIPLRVTGTLVSAGGLVHVREARAVLRRVALAAPAAVASGAGPALASAPGPDAAPAVDEPTVRWDAPPPERPVADGGALWGPAVQSTPVAPSAPASVDPEPAVIEPVSSVPAQPLPPTEAPTSLIVERTDRQEGIAIGKGELVRLSTGRVLPFRGPRPAIRARAGTGRILLSFDSEELRDRAIAELIAEAGLTRHGDGTATDPFAMPAS